MRTSINFPKPSDINSWRNKALQWAAAFNICAYTNPNNQSFPFGSFREIIAADALEIFKAEKNIFEGLKSFHTQKQDWLFGYFGYDLKNQTETILSSTNPVRTNHPEVFFFQPRHLIFIEEDHIRIESEDAPDKIYSNITNHQFTEKPLPVVHFNASMSRKEYIKKAKSIINHIYEGDVYELNLCMEFFAEKVQIDPLSAYLQLTNLSPTPFSGFLRQEQNYLISASPERFLKKEGRKLISQPIKGTSKRSADKETDEKLKTILQNDEKERAENMMIVDLVRNDLARSAEYGTVQVDEMFGIYSFRQWHQMISTVSATVRKEVHWVDIIKNAFPMGSMTGAPKIKVMELIEHYETVKRNVYSGAFGYVSPYGDFDFNVIIRSLTYSADIETLNFQVGSALTFDAIPEKEYEECLLKASAIFQLFNTNIKELYD